MADDRSVGPARGVVDAEAAAAPRQAVALLAPAQAPFATLGGSARVRACARSTERGTRSVGASAGAAVDRRSALERSSGRYSSGKRATCRSVPTPPPLPAGRGAGRRGGTEVPTPRRSPRAPLLPRRARRCEQGPKARPRWGARGAPVRMQCMSPAAPSTADGRRASTAPAVGPPTAPPPSTTRPRASSASLRGRSPSASSAAATRASSVPAAPSARGAACGGARPPRPRRRVVSPADAAVNELEAGPAPATAAGRSSPSRLRRRNPRGVHRRHLQRVGPTAGARENDRVERGRPLRPWRDDADDGRCPARPSSPSSFFLPPALPRRPCRPRGGDDCGLRRRPAPRAVHRRARSGAGRGCWCSYTHVSIFTFGPVIFTTRKVLPTHDYCV